MTDCANLECALPARHDGECEFPEPSVPSEKGRCSMFRRFLTAALLDVCAGTCAICLIIAWQSRGANG